MYHDDDDPVISTGIKIIFAVIFAFIVMLPVILAYFRDM